jgi:recombination protein RecA
VEVLVSPAFPRRASELVSLAVPASDGWGLARLSGRIVEISGWGAAAPLTAAFGLVLEAQMKGEAAAWVTFEDSSFFPPDAAAGGVDLDALAVVRVKDARAGGRAADQLVRSAGFGLVVIDIGRESLAAPLLTRLLGLAQKHDTAVVALTEKPPSAASLSSLVSLRVEARRAFNEDGGGEVEIRVLKDKRRGPGAAPVEKRTCRAPAGLR